MFGLSFTAALTLLIVGTGLLMAAQALAHVLAEGKRWRRTLLTVLNVVGLGCVLAGYTGIGPNHA